MGEGLYKGIMGVGIQGSCRSYCLNAGLSFGLNVVPEGQSKKELHWYKGDWAFSLIQVS